MSTNAKVLYLTHTTGKTVNAVITNKYDGKYYNATTGEFTVSPADYLVELEEDTIIKGLYLARLTVGPGWQASEYLVAYYESDLSEPLLNGDTLISVEEIRVRKNLIIPLNDN